LQALSLARDRAERRRTWGWRLIALGFLLAVSVPVVAGREFLEFARTNRVLFGAWAGQTYTSRFSESLWELVVRDAGWAAVSLSLVLLPIAYWRWRVSGTRLWRTLGGALAVAVALAVSILTFTQSVGEAQPALGLAFAALVSATAFLVAPPSHDPEGLDALSIRRLVRRHRRSG
jgi:hypothetical protein